MRMLERILLGGAMVALLSSSHALAAGQPQKGACKADAQKLCSDVQPGEGRVIECLKTHQADLSPQCATNMKAAEQAVKQMSEACEPDIEKFCFDTTMGKGGVASCLKKHQADLSAGCKDAVAKAKMKK
jgi:hypothetical protein